MRKTTFAIIVLCLCSLCSIEAQTVRKGNKFWDGYTLYTVQEVRMDKYVYMTDPHGAELTLEKTEGQTGEYTLLPSRQADEPPIRHAEFGWRVQYMVYEDAHFLVVRKPSGVAMHTLIRTSNDLKACEQLEELRLMEQDCDEGSKYKYQYVLTNKFLDNFMYPQLRFMRNGILARHGYRFSTPLMQEHFSQMPWYKPCDDNSAIKLNPIEQVNIELINSQEALPSSERPAESDVDQSDM
ncbi:MAG: YARHG domain-containing protein [Prevotella sp.]|nr:YARHG domain-containing protein [Prevotella sp.]